VERSKRALVTANQAAAKQWKAQCQIDNLDTRGAIADYVKSLTGSEILYMRLDSPVGMDGVKALLR
jgi:hypothetical protein